MQCLTRNSNVCIWNLQQNLHQNLFRCNHDVNIVMSFAREMAAMLSLHIQNLIEISLF